MKPIERTCSVKDDSGAKYTVENDEGDLFITVSSSRPGDDFAQCVVVPGKYVKWLKNAIKQVMTRKEKK